ncbi:MAG: DEAD/DEAH box helicase [Betaproteobacteria bacterium]|nr:DEAD/DEAH box helicase [Betaproteobacteria bacterium]
MYFSALGLNSDILKAIEAAGYTEPTPVQAKSIPAAIAGNDLLVSSQTGSGKTAAFVLPFLQRLSQPSPGKQPRVLVLTPTRELAAQVLRATETYGRFLRARSVGIVGGTPMGFEFRALKQKVDIIVATPGRLLDHIRRNSVDLSKLEVLVLDEADRMLDMGFIEDIELIIAKAPATRQTMLFSATLEGIVGRLAQRVTRNATRVQINATAAERPMIDQSLLFADDIGHKSRLLDSLLRDVNLTQALVFTATKRSAEQLSGELRQQGHAARALHGDMSQGDRNRSLQAMRQGRVRIMVATDVAARGLDVPGISHVINFDLPKQAEDYVHRIGRTGRAGRTGIAISFAGHREHGLVKSIERYTTQPIAVSVIAGLEPKGKREYAPGKSRGANANHGRKNGGNNAGNNARNSARNNDSRNARPEYRRPSRPSTRSAGSARPARSSARPY